MHIQHYIKKILKDQPLKIKRYCQYVTVELIDLMPTRVALEIEMTKRINPQKYGWPSYRVVVEEIEPQTKVYTGHNDSHQRVVIDRYKNDSSVYSITQKPKRRRRRFSGNPLCGLNLPESPPSTHTTTEPHSNH